MTSKMKLCEILNGLNPEELDKFKSLLELEKDIPPISRSRLKAANTQDTVELMVETYSEECVELTIKILKKMNRTDLVQRSSDTGSGSKEKQWPSLIQRVETIAPVIKQLLETLAGLSDEELEKFKRVLSKVHLYGDVPDINWRLQRKRDMQDTVFLMVQTYGQQSVEVTEEVLKKIWRLDLVQKLSDGSSGPRKKHSVDENLSALIHKVARRRAVKELLLETLSDLSDEELENFEWLLQFTFFQRSLELISLHYLSLPHTELVDLMLERCGLESLEVTMEVLMDMNRTDLMQRLSGTSSGHKAAGSSAEAFGASTMEGEKHGVDEHCPVPIQKVETMTSVIELLLETLAALSDEELETFKEVLLSEDDFCSNFSYLCLMLPEIKDMQFTVFLMVLTDGQQSVETTKEVLKKMKRTDLVQRMSDSSSGSKKKHSDEHRSALIQKVATMAAVKHLLLETLSDLNYDELDKFMEFLEWIINSKSLADISSGIALQDDRAEMVKRMLQTYSQQSVQLTREALKKMNRTDLVQRLSKPSSELKEKHPAGEHQPEVLEEAVPVSAAKGILLETLKGLSNKELKKFKSLMPFTYFQKGLPHISWSQLERARSAEAVVDLMVENQQSVEVTKEVFMDMNRTDLVKKLSVISSRIKDYDPTTTVFFLQAALTKFDFSMTICCTVLIYKTNAPFLKFHVYLIPDDPALQQEVEMRELSDGSTEIPKPYPMMLLKTRDCFILTADVDGAEIFPDKVKLRIFPNFFEVTIKNPDKDFELRLTQENEHEPVWTCAIRKDDYQRSTSLLPGNFECSVSGLRWVCKETVSFKYQFCSLRGHLERIESMKYMPAGPLMDITVTAGKLDVVYLPHWICINDNPTILDKFAVLHIDDCGDAVEKVSEVTSSHVKLSDPVFSLKMVLVKMGLPVEIYCMVLIYSKILKASSQTTLKLHVYLTPCDLGLQEELGLRKKSHGFNGIEKSNPEKSLKMHDWFILTTDQDGADIYPKGEKPQTLKLRYNSTGPNFYEVVVKNPDKDFKLMLTPENGHQPVWTCEILQGEWQSTEKHSVDKHQEAAIAADGKMLIKMLKELKDEEFKEFKWYLLRISKSQRENSDRVDLVNLMLQTYTHESVKVAKEVLEEIGRNDLVQLLSDTSSGSEAAGSSA